MAKNPLAHALAQIEFHKAKVAKWEQYVTLYRELYGDEDGSQPEATPSSSRPAMRPEMRRPMRQDRREPRSGAIAETRAGARLILEDMGGYVQTGDLIARLADMGIEVGGLQPSSTLSARLSGDPEIESRRGFGYRLKKYAEGAAGSSSGDEPAAPLFAPNSADEDGREVGHDNMTH